VSVFLPIKLQTARWKAADALRQPLAPCCCARTRLRGWTEARGCPPCAACPTSRRHGRRPLQLPLTRLSFCFCGLRLPHGSAVGSPAIPSQTFLSPAGFHSNCGRRCRLAAPPPLQDAAAELAQFRLLLLLDARPPVANFGYEGGPSQLVELPVRGHSCTVGPAEPAVQRQLARCSSKPVPPCAFAPPCMRMRRRRLPDGSPAAFLALHRQPPFPRSLQEEAVWEFDSGAVDLPGALRLLCQLVGGDGVRPGTDCRGAFCAAARPPLPTGACRCCAAGLRQRTIWNGVWCLCSGHSSAQALPLPRRPPDGGGAVQCGGGAAAGWDHLGGRVAHKRRQLLCSFRRLPPLQPPDADGWAACRNMAGCLAALSMPLEPGAHRVSIFKHCLCLLAPPNQRPPPILAMRSQAGQSGRASPWRWAPPWPAPAASSSNSRPTAVPCTACRGCGRRWGLGGAVPPCVLVLVEGGGWARALLNHASIAARHEHLRSARHPAPSRLRLPGKLRAVSPCVVPQAREQLHVVTVVCANRSYSILRVELAKQRIAPRCDDRRPACEPRAS
jgi:hypothetical protein